MEKIPFNESEIEVIKEVEARGAITRFYNRPITEKENMRRLYYEDYPMWIPAGRASNLNFCPKCIPDNIARAFVYDGSGFDSSTDQQQQRRGIGLQNVQQRLRYLNIGSVQIVTTENGTCATIQIDRSYSEEEEL